jgi:hypothetical protein
MDISLEHRNLDKLKGENMKSDNVSGMSSCCINISQKNIHKREYRCEVLLFLVKTFEIRVGCILII